VKPSQLNPRAVITNPLALVLGYAVFGALWILLSDRAVEWLLHDPALVAIANTLKGWAFIALTSLLLYMMMRNWMGPAGDPPAPVSRHSLWPPVTLACVVIAGLTAVAIGYNFSRHKQTEVARLQSIADLKAWQIKAWLEERQGDVAFLQSSRLLTELYRNWRERGDSASRDRLLERFGQFGMSKGYEKVVLLDEQGEPLRGSSGQTPGVAPELLNDARQAVASGESPLIVSLGTANGELDLNFAASLPVPGGGPSPIIILNVNPAGYLTPLLQKWPVPSSSAETLLFRRRGDQVLYLNRLRHEPDAQGLLRLPIATKSLLAAQVLRGENKPSRAVRRPRLPRRAGGGCSKSDTWHRLVPARQAGSGRDIRASLARFPVDCSGGAVGDIHDDRRSHDPAAAPTDILHSWTDSAGEFPGHVGLTDAGRILEGRVSQPAQGWQLFVEFAVVAPIRQADGRVTHYVAVKEDITEKKRLGAELDNYRHHLEDWSPAAHHATGRSPAFRPRPPTSPRAPSWPT
jgi:hypothetical protein